MQILSYNSYRDFLKAELISRSRKNSMYSLRAFARDLQIHPGRLCEILSGKQGLSLGAAARLADHLQLDPGNRENFLDMVQAEHARSRAVRADARRRVQESIAQMSPDGDFTWRLAVNVQPNHFRALISDLETLLRKYKSTSTSPDEPLLRASAIVTMNRS
jgi:plasmid maintenance system antidote protein VapI